MNAFLWILQIAMAFLYCTGGSYKIFQTDQLMGQTLQLSRAGWQALGAFEVIGGILVIVPALMNWKPVLSPIAAAALAVETLILAALYARYSTAFAVTNPMTWAIVMGALAAIVAYGRFTR